MATLNLDLGIDVKNLVVLDSVEFEKSLMKSMTTNIGVGDTEGKGEMLFGLFGIIFEKFAPSNLSFPEIQIDMDLKTSEDWKKAMAVARKIIDGFEPHLPPKIRLLKEVLSHPEKFQVALLQANQGDMLLRITPHNILELINEKIWNNFENVIINDDIIETNGDAFLKKALHLQTFETKKTITEQPEFQTFPDLPIVKDKYFPEAAAKKIATMTKEHKNIIIVFPSNGPISHFIDKINAELESQGIKEDKTIMGQGSSGSNGKIINKLNPEGNNILLINFDFALELIEVFKDREIDNIALTFTKLPFMHPENPYMKYMERFYASGYEAYKGYSLPKAKCRIRKLIARYTHEFTDTKAYVCDNRINKG